MEALKLSRSETLEIRRRRLDGVTQHDLATEAGLNPVYGAEVLRGNTKSAAGLDKLEAALERLERAALNDRASDGDRGAQDTLDAAA